MAARRGDVLDQIKKELVVSAVAPTSSPRVLEMDVDAYCALMKRSSQTRRNFMKSKGRRMQAKAVCDVSTKPMVLLDEMNLGESVPLSLEEQQNRPSQSK